MKSVYLSHTLFVGFLVVSLLTCGVNPTNPAIDPGNANVELFMEQGSSLVITQGDVRRFGLRMDYTHHFERITVTSTCGILDTTIIPDTSKQHDTIYFSLHFTEPGECNLTVSGIYRNSTLKDRQNITEFYVKQAASGVAFVTTPSSFYTQAGSFDTLLFTSKTAGNAGAQEYSVSSVPVLDQPQLSILPSTSRDTVRILFHPAAADTYTVTVTATAQVPGAAPVKATALVGVRVYGAVVPTKMDVPQNILAGVADTLRFAVDNSTRPDKLKMKLVADKPLDAAIFTILPSSADSIFVAVAAGATIAAGTVKIGVSTSNGVITDTSWYPITFVDKESAFWNVAEVAVAASEGTLLRYDLRPYVTKPQSGGVTFTSDIGVVAADTFWQYTPAYGTATPVKATITAQKGTAALDFTVTVNVTATDSTPPTLTLVDAILNGKKVSSSQITVASNATDNGAGVAKVTYSWGGKTIDAAIQADNTWSGIITGLENGKATDVTVTAIDKSMKKNSASITFTVTYETATSDTTPPVITTQPEPAASVIEGETLTLTVAASGTSALTYQWYKNDVLLPGQANATFTKAQATAADTGSYYVVVAKSNGRDVASNKAVVTIRLTAKITEDPVSKEANEGGSVSFTVKAEGEAPLTYQWLRDGTAISGATAASYTLSSITTTDDKKSFKCVVNNSFSKDTSAAAVVTVLSTSIYTVTFESNGGSAIAEQKIKSGMYAQEPAQVPIREGFEFGGWFTTSSLVTAFDFSGVAITAPRKLYAKWAPVYTVTYVTNSAQSGVVPIDANQYKNGETVVVLGNTGSLTKNGYQFDGWNTLASGSGTVRTVGSNFAIGSASCTLYVAWKAIDYPIIYHVNDGVNGANPSSYTIASPAITLAPATKKSYTFAGWFGNANCTGPAFTQIPASSTENRELWAKWIITDIDGNVYTEVKIGNQVWMVENLKTTRFNDGGIIPYVIDSTEWGALTTPGYCWYYNDSTIKQANGLGALYNWYTVAIGKLAPAGWHVPDTAEWNSLATYLGGANVAGGKLKDTLNWRNPNTGATNETGFTAISAGCRWYSGSSYFAQLSHSANWWSTTTNSSAEAWYSGVNYLFENLDCSERNKKYGYSVRCLRDW